MSILLNSWLLGEIFAQYYERNKVYSSIKGQKEIFVCIYFSCKELYINNMNLKSRKTIFRSQEIAKWSSHCASMAQWD